MPFLFYDQTASIPTTRAVLIISGRHYRLSPSHPASRAIFLSTVVAGAKVLASLAAAPMADVAVVILRVVAEIRDVAEGIRENDRQACRLFKRVLSIESPVLAVQEGTKMSSSESLSQLLATVKKIRKFLKGYARTTRFDRALKRKTNAAKFTQLGVTLTEGMKALQLDVALDTWAKEDASDRLEELEYMVDMMETMDRNRTDNHAEVMVVLKVSVKGDPIWQPACNLRIALVITIPDDVLPFSSLSFVCPTDHQRLDLV